MNTEQEVLKINRVKAVVKDIKVSKNGITLNLENVQLTGEQISEVSALVSGMVYIDIEERLPESLADKYADDNQTTIFDALEDTDNTEEENLSDEDVLGALELNSN